GKVSMGSRKVNAYVATLFTPSYVTGTLAAYNGAGTNFISASKASSEPNKTRGWEQMQMNVTGDTDVAVSSGAHVGFRGGYFRDRFSDSGIPETTAWLYSTAANAITLPGFPQYYGPVNSQNTPLARTTDFDTTTRRFFSADYLHTFQASGWHTLKGGVGYQHTLNDVDSRYPGGYVEVFWGSTLALAGQAPDKGTYGYYAVNNRGTFGKAGANIISLYVQDQWQIADRLTLSLGIRAEDEKVPSFKPEIQENVLDFPFSEKIAPRLGFSYDAMGNGRAKLYASWGRYFDWTKYEMPRGSFGGDVWCIKYRAIDNPNDPLVANFDNAPGRDLWKGGGNCRDRRVPSFDTIDTTIKPMSQDSTSAGFDFELNPRTVATIHYVHNNLNRTIEDLGALVNGNEVYLIGNPGEGNSKIMPASAAPLTGGGSFEMPKAKRQYDAVELGVSRRFSNNWFGSANLTFSRLYGNYAGISSSDEIRTPTTGTSSATAQQQAGSIFREGGNVNRNWDLDDSMFDSHGNLDYLGRLATDRPVVAKFYGGYNIASNTQIGAFVYAGSGTPVTTYVNTVNQTEVFVEGRGDMGRTPVYSKTDLLASHEIQMSGNRRLRLELNVLNLFNQKTARHTFNYLNRGAGAPRASSAINLANNDLFKGYDYKAMVSATPDGANAYDPRYGMEDLFEAGTQGQFSIKFLF
ncbi:MAG: TonB-dependent receptor, partial [Vicinamibacterales bacterium]|nr:TonB-dependent receptor [Vicinamibacterales bacterium]